MMTKPPKINPLIDLARHHEEAIRTNYCAEIMGMQDDNNVRDQNKWNEFCDQDQLFYLAYYAVSGLEELHIKYDEDPNDDGKIGWDFIRWLRALFAVEAVVLNFNTEV